ncbi:MAG: sugar phosphate isomerase/epimerase [Candidatus Aminicenantales bacterium]
MTRFGRRNFLKTGALGMMAATFNPGGISPALVPNQETKGNAPEFGLGLASYTFREFSLERTIEMTKRLALGRIVLKSMHLPLESPEAEVTAAAEKVRAAGLDLYGCGVVYMTTDAEVEQAFRYAQAAKMKMIIGVANPELLGRVERKVRETDIRLAIHNHGPEDKLYPTPGSAYEKIKNLDRRLGLCIDVGHTIRAGVEPSAAAEKFGDRLLDVHIKDVTAASKDGQTVEIGRGVIDIPKFIRTLIRLSYKGTLAFEFEKDGSDPLPGLAESVGYLRGVLSVI